MQPSPPLQDQILARFMDLSRLHLGLMQDPVPVAVIPPPRVAGPSRQILRSLIVASSLGALFGGPAFATEGSRPSDSTKRTQSAPSTRAKADERLLPSHEPSVSAKYH